MKIKLNLLKKSEKTQKQHFLTGQKFGNFEKIFIFLKD